MKKLSLIAAIVCVLVLCMVPFAASAEEDALSMSMDPATVKQGYDVDIPINVVKNPGIFGTQIEIYYDQKVLRYDGTTAGEAFTEKMDLLEIDPKSYPVVIQYMANNIENVNTTGLLATIHFKAYVGCTVGETKLTVKYSKGNTINADSVEVPVVINDAVITVTDGLTSTDNEEDLPPKDSQTKAAPEGAAGTTPKEPSNHTWIFFVIGAIVLVVAGVLIWLFAGNDEEKKEEPKGDGVASPEIKDDSNTSDFE